MKHHFVFIVGLSVSVALLQCNIEGLSSTITHTELLRRTMPHQWISTIKEDRAVFMSEQLFGVKDAAGNVIIPQIYERIIPQQEGLFCAKKEGLYGFIDRNGQTVIPFQFQWADSFKNGQAEVFRNGTFMLINHPGT